MSKQKPQLKQKHIDEINRLQQTFPGDLSEAELAELQKLQQLREQFG